MDDDEHNELIEKLQSLSIEQQQLVQDLVDQLVKTNDDNRDTVNATYTSETNIDRIDNQGNTLSIGDKVEILTTRRTGIRGDTAVIVKFTRRFTEVKLDRNGSPTHRRSKYLSKIISGVEDGGRNY